ncbi:MAG TPA: MFS transporter [Kineosporiaceae bacterium]|nr:MFS transporter [Kineosporiaceae bacterium]
MSPVFRSLRNPNYRLWAAGALVSNTGTWMQRVAQDWLVLTVLTHNSALAVGITTGLQFGPVVLLAPLAGTVSDRLERRRVLLGTQTASGVLAAVLGLLVVFHLAQLWQVYLLALLLGCVAAVDGPARQAFVSEMVPTEDLPNAVGLNSASFHAGRLIGPGLAGLLIHWFGTGPVFLINAATFGAVLVSLTRMRVDRLIPAPRVPRGRGATRDGLAYVRHRPDILLLLVIVGLVGAFGLNYQITTALMARLVFHKGSGEYGLLGSVMAIGSLAGALLAARREHPTLRLVVTATAAFGLFSGIAALMPSYPLFAVSLIPVGLSALTLMTAANATVQLSVEPQLRGRVMALYMAVFMGGTPVGSPLVGWIGQQFGARWTILVGAVVSLVTALGAAGWLLRQRSAPGPAPAAGGAFPGSVARSGPVVLQGVAGLGGDPGRLVDDVDADPCGPHGVAQDEGQDLVLQRPCGSRPVDQADGAPGGGRGQRCQPDPGTGIPPGRARRQQGGPHPGGHQAGQRGQ